MFRVTELSDKKLEIRAYEVEVSKKGDRNSPAGLTTDSEHKAVWGVFFYDPLYNGDAAKLDTKSTVDLEINDINIFENVHTALLQKTPSMAINDCAWKVNIPVDLSRIKLNYHDGGHFPDEQYPRTISMYLILEKEK